MNIRDDEIYCHGCMSWIDIDTEILILNEIDVVCLRCYPDRRIHLGYVWDIVKFIDSIHELIGD